MKVLVPAYLLEFYNHNHAGDGSGVFAKPNGTYKKGGGSHATKRPIQRESGKYDDSGNEHVGVNVSDNASRQAKEAAAKKAADTKKFTDAAMKIAKRDKISPAQAAKNLGNLLKNTAPNGRTGAR